MTKLAKSKVPSKREGSEMRSNTFEPESGFSLLKRLRDVLSNEKSAVSLEENNADNIPRIDKTKASVMSLMVKRLKSREFPRASR